MCKEGKDSDKTQKDTENFPRPRETEQLRVLQFGMHTTNMLKQRILNYKLHCKNFFSYFWCTKFRNP